MEKVGGRSGRVLLKSWRRVAAVRLFNDFGMMYHRFVLSILCQRGRGEECFHTKKEVCVCVCTSLLAFLSLAHVRQHTHSETLKYPLSFLITLFSVSPLSVFLKEFSIHLIPLLVLLYWGWAPLVFHVKGFLFYWTSNPLCLAWRSLLTARHHAYSGAGGCAIRPASPPKSAIVGISVAITLHE